MMPNYPEDINTIKELGKDKFDARASKKADTSTKRWKNTENKTDKIFSARDSKYNYIQTQTEILRNIIQTSMRVI